MAVIDVLVNVHPVGVDSLFASPVSANIPRMRVVGETCDVKSIAPTAAAICPSRPQIIKSFELPDHVGCSRYVNRGIGGYRSIHGWLVGRCQRTSREIGIPV